MNVLKTLFALALAIAPYFTSGFCMAAGMGEANSAVYYVLSFTLLVLGIATSYIIAGLTK